MNEILNTTTITTTVPPVRRIAKKANIVTGGCVPMVVDCGWSRYMQNNVRESKKI